MRRLMLGLFLLVLAPSLGLAQTEKDSWDNVKQLQPGQKIQVVDMNWKSFKGDFLGFTDEMISLRVKKDEVTVPREEVLRVSLRGKPKRGLSALVGAGLGAGVGVIVGAAVGAGYHEAGETGLFMLVFTPIGAGAGAGVGAAAPFIRSHQTVYRAERRQ